MTIEDHGVHSHAARYQKTGWRTLYLAWKTLDRAINITITFIEHMYLTIGRKCALNKRVHLLTRFYVLESNRYKKLLYVGQFPVLLT